MGPRKSVRLDLFPPAALALLLMFQIGCSSSSSTPPPPPPPTKYDHDITIATPLDMETGAPITSGSYTVIMNPNTAQAQTYQGTLGQELTLAKTTKQIELCEVVITASGYLQRTYNKGEITTGTTLAPTLLPTTFPIQTYLTYISPTGQNIGVSVRDWNITFNPDPQTGLPLDDIYKQGVKVAIYDPSNPVQTQDFKHWSWVPNWPTDSYFLRNITYSDGTHIIDTTVPSDGDFWVFRVTYFQGTSCNIFPDNGLDVRALKMFVNEDSADQVMVTNETQIAFFHGIPGIGGHPDLPYWSMLVFNRPNTSDYSISLTGEAQDGFDARSTNTPTSDASYLGSKVDENLIWRINARLEKDPSTYIIPGRVPHKPGEKGPEK